MDLRRLRYFVTVAEEGHVGRAAQRLQISQPPLSQRIRELEDELGCALFVRTPRGMVLTKPGEVLLAETRELLTTMARVRDRVQAAAGAAVVRVGVIGPAEEALSEGIAIAFAKQCPNVEVRLLQGDFSDPTLGLTVDQVDVAITYAPFRDASIAWQPVREHPRCAALPASDPLAAADSLTRHQLRGHRGITLPKGTDPQWQAYWQPNSSDDGPVVRSLDECLHAVLWQHAVALVPEPVRRSHPIKGIAYIPVTDDPPAQLVLAWRRNERSPLVAAYREAFLSMPAPPAEGAASSGKTAP